MTGEGDAIWPSWAAVVMPRPPSRRTADGHRHAMNNAAGRAHASAPCTRLISPVIAGAYLPTQRAARRYPCELGPTAHWTGGRYGSLRLWQRQARARRKIGLRRRTMAKGSHHRCGCGVRRHWLQHRQVHPHQSPCCEAVTSWALERAQVLCVLCESWAWPSCCSKRAEEKFVTLAEV
jgi:hypothetical protein